MSEKIRLLTFDNSKLRSENTDLKRENLKLTTEINKYKTLSLTGEDHLKKIVNTFDKANQTKARDLELKEILKPKPKEELKEAQDNLKEMLEKSKKQNRGYELR